MSEIIPNWHAIFVHFTVALFSISAIFFILSKFAMNWRLEDQWLAVGYWSLWSGMLLSSGTAVAGWYAFNAVTHDASAYAVMIFHRTLAYLCLGVYVCLGFWAMLGFKAKKQPSVLFVFLLTLSGGLLYATVWYGDQLVFRHGLGVRPLTKSAQFANGVKLDQDNKQFISDPQSKKKLP